MNNKSFFIVFPGQGSQYPGMGLELKNTFNEAKETFQEVDEALNDNLSKIIFGESKEELTKTENAQPALMAVSIAVARVLVEQFNFSLDSAQFTAGHSLGEITAITAFGGFSLSDSAKLLRIRGKAMSKASLGGMLAILKADKDKINQLIQGVKQNEELVIANDNAPGQIVVSGSVGAIARMAEACANEKVRAIKLPVSAPFHSPLMKSATAEFSEALNKIKMMNVAVPVVSNVTALPEGDPDQLSKNLVAQVEGQVRWRESLLNMQKQGITCQIELGAGNVLTGLAKRTVSDWDTFALENAQAMEDFAKTFLS